MILTHVTGFQTESNPVIGNPAPFAKNIYNAMVMMDWLPGISVISGLARTILAGLMISSGEFSYDYVAKFRLQIARGIISILCLGILFAPFDLYATFGPS